MISYQTKNAGAAGETLSSTIQECEVIYKLDKASGMYRPVFRFCMQDGISYDVDLLPYKLHSFQAHPESPIFRDGL